MDVNSLYHRTVEFFADRVNTVRSDQWADPTPCTEWTVRDLVNHVRGRTSLAHSRRRHEGRHHPVGVTLALADQPRNSRTLSTMARIATPATAPRMMSGR